MADAANNAKAITLPAEHTILHTIRQRICVDGVEVSDNPAGMLGRKVEAHVHVIYGNSLRIQNSMRLVQSLSIEVNQPVFNGLANAQAVLTLKTRKTGLWLSTSGVGPPNLSFSRARLFAIPGSLPSVVTTSATTSLWA